MCESDSNIQCNAAIVSLLADAGNGTATRLDQHANKGKAIVPEHYDAS